jgi:hypothetical protein
MIHTQQKKANKERRRESMCNVDKGLFLIYISKKLTQPPSTLDEIWNCSR